MEGFQLEIGVRKQGSTSVNNRLRKDGKIPAIVYRRGENSIPGAISYKDFVRLAQMAKSSQIFSLVSTDPELSGKPALVRDIQKDYLTGKVIHVDFQALKEDEQVRVTVPLKFVGDPVGVKTEGGMLSIHTYELTVSCLPKDIPSEIKADISGLHINSHLHASDLVLPNGVSLIAGRESEPIVSVTTMKEETVASTEGATAESSEAVAVDAKATATPATGAKAVTATKPAAKK